MIINNKVNVNITILVAVLGVVVQIFKLILIISKLGVLGAAKI